MAISLAGARITSPLKVAIPVLGAAFAALVVALVVAIQLNANAGVDPLWQPTSELLGFSLINIASASRVQPILSLGPMLLFTSTFCRFVLMAPDAARARATLRAIAYVGLAHALFASAMFIVDPTSVLGQPKSAYRANLTGTFVNRNNAATFFGTMTLVWLTLLMSSVKRMGEQKANLRDLVWLLARGSASRIAWRSVGFTICLGATAATGSRAGFILTILIVTLALAIYLWPTKGSWKLRPFAILAASLVGLLVLEVAGDSVGSRIGLLGFDDEGRYEVYAACLELIAARPWLGIGLGNFAAVFPSIRPDSLGIVGIWDRAHSSPLELALEIGVPAFAVVALIWLGLTAALAWRAWRRRQIWVIAALGTVLLGTFHSLIDFSLQTPGYAVLFAAIAGLGLSGASTSSQNHGDPLARPADASR